MLVLPRLLAGRQEVVAVPDRLDDEEERVEHDGRRGRERELGGGELRPGGARRERRQDEAERGERDDRPERGCGTLRVEGRGPLAQRAQQDRQPDDPVAGDHDRREDGVARERVRRLVGGHHQRHDQADLDHRHRNCEHERSERLAHAVCHHLGVVDRRQDCRGEQQAHDNQTDAAGVGAPGDDEHDERRAAERACSSAPRAVPERPASAAQAMDRRHRPAPRPDEPRRPGGQPVRRP